MAEKEKSSEGTSGKELSLIGSEEDGESKPKIVNNAPGWKNRAPLPKSVQRRRNNARIRKMVAPKPPIQVLNEMVGAGNVLSNTLPLSKDGYRMTTVEINVEGKTFTGIGPTPSIAKNIAAEAAVHHIATIMSSDPTEEEIQTGRAFEDSTPWGALASLALFKLFTDWQASGYPIPVDMCPNKNMGPKGPGAGGAPLAAMSFVPEGDPSMMGGPPAIEAEGAEGEGGGEGFSGDPSDFADDAGTFKRFGPMNPRGRGGGPMRGRGGMMMMGPRGGHGFHPYGPPRGAMMGGQRGAFSSYPAMMPPTQGPKHPVSLLHEKLGPKAKCDYVFTETGDHPQNKVFTCTLTLGKEGEAQFVGRKGAPIGIFTGEASNKKEAKRVCAVNALAELYEKPKNLQKALM